MPPQPDLTARREEAKLAMEGDEHRAARAAREQVIGKRRVEARLAMESPTHRAKREIKERTKRDVGNAAAAQADAERARREAAARLVAEAEAKTQEQVAAKQADVTARVKTARNAAVEIKNLQGRPAHLSALRTLKTDMAEAVSRGGSITGAIIRGNELGTNQVAPPPAGRSHAMLTVILILVFLGVMAGGGTFLYQKWLANSPIPSTPGTATSTLASPTGGPNSVRTSFVFADHRADINVADQTAPVLLGKIRAARGENQTPGTIDELRFLKNGAPLALRAWQTLLGLPFPDDFTRLIEPTFMFGFYRGGEGSVPLIILKTKSTAPAYSQLLAGEKNLPAVWNTVLGQPPLSLPGISTGFPEGKPDEPVVTSSFRDLVIQNLDTRILDGPGVPQPVLYGFLDPHTILLTQTRAAFLEILTRFRAGR